MILIILGSIVSLLSISVAACGIAMIYGGIAEMKRPEPWTIVENASGQYSYINFNGELANESYPTREQAAEKAAWWCKWNADYQAGKFAADAKAEEARKAERARTFKPIAP